MFDVFYLGQNPDLIQNVPFAKQVNSVSEIKPDTKMYWLIEPDIQLLEFSVLDYRPPEHDQCFEHVWKWNTQNYGGVRLLPRSKPLGVKQFNRVICKKTFQIMFSSNPGNYFEQHAYATHVWCVDPEYKLSDDINWAPDNFEPIYIHSFHLKSQLEHKYPDLEGGVKLYPRNWKSADVKYHGFLDAGTRYPVLFVEDPEDYSQRDNFEDDYVWLIDKHYQIDVNSLDWVPNPFQDQYIHSFRMPNQLQEKMWSYKHPDTDRRLGGIRLVPKQWRHAYNLIPNGLVIHSDCPVDDLIFDVFYINDDEFTSETYQAFSERSKTEWFWVVDKEYEFNGKLVFVPADHEQDYIQVFKIPGMLEERYPPEIVDAWDTRCGGVRLVNKNFDITKHKYQQGILPVKYDIFYTTNVKNSFSNFARKSKTKMFWVIDQEYLLDNNFKIVVPRHEQNYLLNFQVDQLQHKYPEHEGGIYLVPKTIDNTTPIKYKGILDQTINKIKKYPVHLVSDPTNIAQAIPESWMIDSEYQIETEIDWVPSSFERNMIHVFQVRGQLKHKYPDAMGGVYWYPADPASAQIKIHTEPLTLSRKDMMLYETEQQGRAQTISDWFWVVDPEVTVLPDFDFDFIPEVWDAGKTHVWQKLNPITKRQYDYAGVMLCPKEPNQTGRPKYMRQPACVQREYPVYYLTPADYTKPLEHAYRRFSELCDTSMYWVVDAYTQLEPDFAFDYYPTQWDQKCVHVFQNADAEYKNVRLVPKHTFLDNSYTDDQIANNGFPDLKLINTTASIKPEWPVINLSSVERNQFINAIKASNSAFVWTIDPDIKVDHAVLASGFTPKITDIHKVHTWQKVNAVTGHTHSYGGLRLWPTDISLEQVTTDSLRLNRFKNMQYVRSPGSFNKLYDVVFISYHEPQAESAYNHLRSHLDNISTVSGDRFNLIWVKDVPGIFQAHRQAAELASTDLFWVVDADAQVHEDFKFDYVADVYDLNVTHVWHSLNPVTGLQYGYGGIKLLPRELVMSVNDWGLDFTTGLSTRIKVMTELSCVTRFNTDAFNTWRSAFRECVKLALKTDMESIQRLDAWLHPVPDAYFRHEAKRGAEQGKQFAIQHQHQPDVLNNINNFEWLTQQFYDS